MLAWQTFEREGKGSFRREGNATGARGGRKGLCLHYRVVTLRPRRNRPWVRDRSIFNACGRGGGRRILGGDHLIFGRTKGGTVVTENPKGWISEKFGRSKRGDNSNLLEK